VSQPKEVVKEIAKHSQFSRVHTFGIGSGASKYLVKECAKVGNGTYSFVEEGDTALNSKVIKALKKAATPCYTNLQIDFGKNEQALKFYSPQNGEAPNLYEEEPVTILAVFDKSELVSSDVKMNAFNTHTQEIETFSVPISLDNMVSNLESEPIFKVAAGDYIKHLEKKNKEILNEQDSDEETKEENEILPLSVKYKVLSTKTAFFAKVKNKKSSKTETKQFSINVEKLVSL
jgi:predicted  nucleic acid-binding Zn-ribbon protein